MPSTRQRRGFLFAVIFLASWACNSRTDVPGLNTTPTASTPVASSPTNAMFSLSFNPAAVYAGNSTSATAVLAMLAPAGGSTVTLASQDPAVTVPSSITVPGGSDRATFVVPVQSIPGDRDVIVIASYQGRSAVTKTLSVWAVLPTFFSFISDYGDAIGNGAIKRFTSQNASFSASCNASQVKINILGGTQFWRATFGAPGGTRLAPGAYENTVPASTAPVLPTTTSPEMTVDGNGSTCSGTGRFVVHEVDLTSDGHVNQFWASFEQHCVGLTAGMKGDVRVTAPGPLSTGTTCN